MESLGHTVYVISHTDEDVGGHESQTNVFGIIDISKPDWERVIFKKIMDLKPDVGTHSTRIRPIREYGRLWD